MKILQTLNRCSECYYKEVYIKNDISYFRCDHSGYEGQNDFRPIDNDLSKGCPLKDVGVKVGISTILLNEHNQFLIGQRIGTGSGDGLWGLPGGRMDLWEDPMETAVRETQEETGIIVDRKDLEFVFMTNDIFKDINEHWITLYYLTRKWEGRPIVMEPNKCSEWKWATVFGLPDGIFCDWKIPLRTYLHGE